MLCSSANELQQNSNACSREEIYSTNIDCLVIDSSPLHLTFVAFRLCLSFVNHTLNNLTTPSSNERLWPDSGKILRHQYEISVAESQTFLLVNLPQRRGARRNGCFPYPMIWRNKLRFTFVSYITWDQALFSFRFENNIPAGKAPKRECMKTARIGPDLRFFMAHDDHCRRMWCVTSFIKKDNLFFDSTGNRPLFWSSR